MANYTDGDDQAFPRDQVNSLGIKGLTKREYFAAQAIVGLMAHSSSIGRDARNIALDAVKVADALIEALSGEIIEYRIEG